MRLGYERVDFMGQDPRDTESKTIVLIVLTECLQQVVEDTNGCTTANISWAVNYSMKNAPECSRT